MLVTASLEMQVLPHAPRSHLTHQLEDAIPAPPNGQAIESADLGGWEPMG